MSEPCTEYIVARPLSPREQQVVELLVSGCTQKEIARRLGISKSTVATYFARVQVKTAQPTMISAVSYVLLHGLILPIPHVDL